ncbi:MAG TPA: tryptophan halogenase family protein [Croceibacterium sp.]
MRDDLIRKVVIVGGGTSGWMAAAALAKILGAMPGLSIELVESEAIGTVGVGEATVPPIVLFNSMLGLDEMEFMRETHATYKLGIEFVDWARIGHRYCHPFGSYGLDMLGIDFLHHWLKGRELGDTSAFDEYSIATMAANANKFFPPTPEQPKSPLAKLAYAYQFDAGLYARYLRRYAEQRGVGRIEGRIVEVEQHPESGFITALRLDNGKRVEGELFIDCSGFRSLLLGQTLGVPFVDWSKWLPNDRAVAIPCKLGPDRKPITRSTARSSGWQWNIPLQHRVGNGHVYCSAYISDDEATEVLLANLEAEPLASPNQLRFLAGHRAKAWDKNVVALGLAGGFLEPLESTSIHLVQTGIARLMTLFPTRDFGEREIERYNRETVQQYVDIRDFLVLHYCATERDDSEYWNYCRNIEPPEGLAEKLAMYRSSGRVFGDQKELFTETSWEAVLIGQGIAPGGYHPVADLLPDDETLRRLASIRGTIAQTVAQMPTQEQFLESNGGAIDPAMRMFA